MTQKKRQVEMGRKVRPGDPGVWAEVGPEMMG